MLLLAGISLLNNVLSYSHMATPTFFPNTDTAIPSAHPTGTLKLTPSPIATPVSTLAANSPSAVADGALGYTLVIWRSPEAIAICVNRQADLRMLRVDFVGQNESYTLGSEFPDHATTETEACWCLQRSSPQFVLPPSCREADSNPNISSQPRTSDWRNAAVTLLLDGQPIGECPAQPGNLDVYSCDIIVDEE